MHLPSYETKIDITGHSFYFVSEGPRGKIRKVVQLSPLTPELVYNLSLCDYNPETNAPDDSIVTDNGDTEMILTTVAKIVYNFCAHFPERWIYATGNTPVRTRLYRMGINKYYETIKADFEIYGEVSEGWETYQKGKNYGAFLVRRKTIKFGI